MLLPTKLHFCVIFSFLGGGKVRRIWISNNRSLQGKLPRQRRIFQVNEKALSLRQGLHEAGIDIYKNTHQFWPGVVLGAVPEAMSLGGTRKSLPL